MITLPGVTAKLALVVSCVALLALACSPDSKDPSGPSGPTQSTSPSAVDVLQGAAGNFTVLANAAITCTNGMVTGNVGVKLPAPIGSVTQTSCPIPGNKNVGDAAAVLGYNDFLSKYAALAPTSQDICTATLTGTLAGQTLTPGTYCFDAAAALTGILTLQGPADGIWTFKIGAHAVGALTGTNFSVVLSGGAQQCNVTWWVDAAATMTDSHFLGTILAGAAITLIRGTFDGNAWAGASGVGDVTITNTTVTGCKGGTGGTGGGGTITNPPPLENGYLWVCKDTPAGTSGKFQIDAWIKFDDGTEHSVGTYINSGECKPMFVSLPDPTLRVHENLGNGDPGWHVGSVTRITNAGTDELSGNNIGTVDNPVVCSIDFTHGCVLIFHNVRDTSPPTSNISISNGDWVNDEYSVRSINKA